MNIDAWIAIVSIISGTMVAVVSIRSGNENNRQQIRTEKLEEAFQTIQLLSRNYGGFKELWFKIQQLRNKDDSEIKTLQQYYTQRDEKISNDDRRKIEEQLSRLEVLALCYTSGTLKKKIKQYEISMFSFLELIIRGGSIQQEIHFPSGYPHYEDFYSLVEDLKKEIVAEIKL